MNTSSLRHPHLLRMSALAVIAALLLAVGYVPLAAQTTPNAPSALPAGVVTDTWAVQLAPGVDPNAAAAQAGMVNLGQIGSLTGYYRFKAAGIVGRADAVTTRLRSVAGVISAEQQVTRRLAPRNPTDPLLPDQWHLNNTGQGGGTVGEDANVFAAWNLGYDGTGVVVASVDDGIRTAHKDIAPNWRQDLSYDYVDDDNNPNTGDHGQAVAGVMAAADETTCGVGVAYNAGISGLNVLYNMTDANIADALSFSNNIDIYNNSWGPIDDGVTLDDDVPGPLTQAAIQDGVTTGRDGLGFIYVWAAGNGRASNDNVNADAYASDYRVIAVGASTNQGKYAWYSEPGAAMLINAPSSGGTRGITTSSSPGNSACTNSFGGTSSAAPLVAGVVALMLDANPNLTWRDVKHILVESADKNDPTDSDWKVNAAGYNINHNYGLGRVNAGAAVQTAANWVNVPPMVTSTSAVTNVNQPIPDNNPTGVSSTITVTDNLKLEHAVIVLNATHTYRGDLEVELTAPSGTVSRMIYGRVSDGGDNYTNWKMMTVRNWGEMSAGNWTLKVKDVDAGVTGTFVSWQLLLYGFEPTTETELLVNGGFETDADMNTIPDNWTAKNLTGDRIRCNTPTKTFSHNGLCAFRFRGNAGEASSLQQSLSSETLGTLSAGDTLTLSAWVKTSVATPGSMVRARGTYSDATKFKLNLPVTTTSGYQKFTLSGQLASAPTSMKVMLRYRLTSGKVLIDDVSLTRSVPSARGVVPLPSSDNNTNGVIPLPAADNDNDASGLGR